MLPVLAVNAVLMMAIALGLSLFNAAPPQVIAHIAFALGIMPLILAAIAYFVPVLSRSGGAPRWLAGMPLFAWLGGICMLAGFLGALPMAAAAYAGALLALLAALTVLAWIARRAKQAFGKPHPGLAWYLAAVIFLSMALAAVLLMVLWPEQRSALRLIHLHANLLGFVGLTAIGTLQVLLPTAAGRSDPGAASRLAQDLKFAVVGAALIALGAAWSTALAGLGAALFLVPLLRMGTRWAAGFDDQIGRLHGAAPSLALACLALVGLLFAGFGHARGFLSGRDAAAGFVVAFLLPLVTGAVTQLLPVWLRPGLREAWHDSLRNRLGRYSGLRAALLVAGGLAAAFGWPQGLWLAALGMALFVGALLGSAKMWR